MDEYVADFVSILLSTSMVRFSDSIYLKAEFFIPSAWSALLTSALTLCAFSGHPQWSVRMDEGKAAKNMFALVKPNRANSS